jgi:uncharacterized protein (TIGR03083 family)
MSQVMDIRTTNPFPHYDAEVARIRDHLRSLDEDGWNAPSHCHGWSVKDVLAHLAAGETYNQACLDGNLDELDFSGGIDGWNARAVQMRRSRAPGELLEEWTALQADVRQRWGRLGIDREIATSVGPYPLRLQVWHIAQEYATHGDDIEVSVPNEEREIRLHWRSIFALFARKESGHALVGRLADGRVVLGEGEELDLESFVAFLTERPQHLKDLGKRQQVLKLLASAR